MNTIEAIDRELERLHKELSSFNTDDDGELLSEYGDVLAEITRVNKLLCALALKEKEENAKQAQARTQGGWSSTVITTTPSTAGSSPDGGVAEPGA